MATLDPLNQATAMENMGFKARQLDHSLILGKSLHADCTVQSFLKNHVAKWNSLEHLVGVSHIPQVVAVQAAEEAQAAAAHK